MLDLGTQDIIFSVSDISNTLKQVVETAFEHIKVKGEVSGVKRATSGHIYFSIKDENAVLNAICWRGCSTTTNQAIEDGMEIIATGHLSTYPGRSNYQMIVQSAEIAGEGALLKLLEDRKKKLAAEGLFDAAHKKRLPFLPETIGVITSPTGAVIRDIMHRLNDRFARNVLLWPVLVQGDKAAEQIDAAIAGFDAIPANGIETPNGHIPRPDLLIVARGGGSLEDLWCFNEEIVVRAAYACRIPLISAVGHETDTTLIDYVSDLRAPTPTGAAEKAVPVLSDILSQIQETNLRLTQSLYRLADEKKNTLAGLTRGLPNLKEMIELYVQKLDDRTERLDSAWKGFFSRLNDRFHLADRLLSANSYERTLEKGFAFITSSDGRLITSASQAIGQMDMRFKDGSVPVVALNEKSSKQPTYQPRHTAHMTRTPTTHTSQGELF